MQLIIYGLITFIISKCLGNMIYTIIALISVILVICIVYLRIKYTDKIRNQTKISPISDILSNTTDDNNDDSSSNISSYLNDSLSSSEISLSISEEEKMKIDKNKEFIHNIETYMQEELKILGSMTIHIINNVPYIYPSNSFNISEE